MLFLEDNLENNNRKIRNLFLNQDDIIDNNYIESDDDLLDLFMYFVDDICEDKIKELDLTIKLYGLLSCSITIILTFTGLLLTSIWIFYLINKDNSENESSSDNNHNNKYIDSYFLEHSFTSDSDKQLEMENDEIKDYKDIYPAKWDIPNSIRKKALFWRANLNPDENLDYKSYNSLIDLYANDTTIQPNQDMIVSNNIDNSNIFLPNDFLDDDDILEKCSSNEECNSEECNNEEFKSARTGSTTDSIQKSLQTNLIDKSLSIRSSVDSLETPLNFQNISLIDDESDHKEFVEEYDIRDDINQPIHILNKSDIDLKLKSIYDDLNIPNSKFYSINMSNCGPQYLIVYLNMIYGSWVEFEQRSMIFNEENSNMVNINKLEKINDKDVKKMIKIINKNSIDEFKKDKIVDKLQTLRIAYITETYHEIILNDIIKNIKFLVKVINNDNVSNQIKCEIYQLFHCSFWYLSEIPLTFDFAESLVNGLINSLCEINSDSTEFKDGIRCLYKILSYSNIDDFISGGIFDHCFNNINNYNFEKQNIVWELLKLIICEWMIETKNVDDICYIYEKLRTRFNNLIGNYVEKDNIKYQEFLYIWKMLREKSNKSNTDFDNFKDREVSDNEIANENEKENEIQRSQLNKTSRINSVSKIKRKLSVTSKRKSYEDTKTLSMKVTSRNISNNNNNTSNNLKDVTNFIKAYD